MPQGQTFRVIGAAGELPKPPETPVQFLEGTLDYSRLASSRFVPIMYPSFMTPDLNSSEIAELEAVSHFTIPALPVAPYTALFSNVVRGPLKLVCESAYIE
jgi:ubiquitin carboxyl-terminal hydrolase 14